jgi:hypothetical protein
MGFYRDGQLAFISPEDLRKKGPWVPERVSQEFLATQIHALMVGN